MIFILNFDFPFQFLLCSFLEIIHTRRPSWFKEESNLLEVNFENEEDMEKMKECDCPKQCNHVYYNVDVSVGDFKAAKFTTSPFL